MRNSRQSGPRPGQRREVDGEHVGFDDVEPGRLAPAGGQVAIELDLALSAADAGEQRPGDRTESRTDLDQGLARLWVDSLDDRLDHALVDEEMLAEPLARAVRHGDARACDQPVCAVPAPLLRRVAQLDVGAGAEVTHPLRIGFVELLLAQDVACLLALLLAIQRDRSPIDHLDEMDAEARP